MTCDAPAGPMRLTRPLRPAPPRYPLEVHPLAKLHGDGRIELLQAAFPPLGDVTLALWRPGEEPAFLVASGRVERGWRWSGPGAPAFVVAWLSAEDPAPPL